MLNKFVVIIGLILLLAFSFKLIKSDSTTSATSNSTPIAKKSEFPTKTFSFNKENITEKCIVDNEQLCAVESAVKCTINPFLNGCKQLDLPKFIFMQDSDILDRPTEISYKITHKKVLKNKTTEFYTDSSCNGAWFGLCQGMVIYVTAQRKDKSWYIKDIYAIE